MLIHTEIEAFIHVDSYWKWSLHSCWFIQKLKPSFMLIHTEIEAFIHVDSYWNWPLRPFCATCMEVKSHHYKECEQRQTPGKWNEIEHLYSAYPGRVLSALYMGSPTGHSNHCSFLNSLGSITELSSQMMRHSSIQPIVGYSFYTWGEEMHVKSLSQGLSQRRPGPTRTRTRDLLIPKPLT